MQSRELVKFMTGTWMRVGCYSFCLGRKRAWSADAFVREFASFNFARMTASALRA